MQQFLPAQSKAGPAGRSGLSRGDTVRLNRALNDLIQTPIYETEKLVQIVNTLDGLAPHAWQESALEAIFAGDEEGVRRLVGQMKDQFS